MPRTQALDYPPYVGNGVADIAYYSVFFVAQIIFGLLYLRRWNWPIFLGLLVFLAVEILGSVAFLKLHYAPVTGAWYNLFIFAFTAAPTFFVSSLHLCVHRAAQGVSPVAKVPKALQPSSRAYIITCLAIDSLALVLSIIGAAYAGTKTSSSPTSSKPGFDVMTAAMAIQVCSLLITLFAGFEVTRSFARHQDRNISTGTSIAETVSDKKKASTLGFHRTPRLFIAFLTGLIFTGIIILARTIIRAVNLAGGFEGPLRGIALVSAETILMFIAILVITVLHPVVCLRSDKHDAFED